MGTGMVGAMTTDVNWFSLPGKYIEEMGRGTQDTQNKLKGNLKENEIATVEIGDKFDKPDKAE